MSNFSWPGHNKLILNLLKLESSKSFGMIVLLILSLIILGFLKEDHKKVIRFHKMALLNRQEESNFKWWRTKAEKSTRKRPRRSLLIWLILMRSKCITQVVLSHLLSRCQSTKTLGIWNCKIIIQKVRMGYSSLIFMKKNESSSFCSAIYKYQRTSQTKLTPIYRSRWKLSKHRKKTLRWWRLKWTSKSFEC
jgi:hypothetical protein